MSIIDKLTGGIKKINQIAGEFSEDPKTAIEGVARYVQKKVQEAQPIIQKQMMKQALQPPPQPVVKEESKTQAQIKKEPPPRLSMKLQQYQKMQQASSYGRLFMPDIDPQTGKRTDGFRPEDKMKATMKITGDVFRELKEHPLRTAFEVMKGAVKSVAEVGELYLEADKWSQRMLDKALDPVYDIMRGRPLTEEEERRREAFRSGLLDILVDKTKAATAPAEDVGMVGRFANTLGEWVLPGAVGENIVRKSAGNLIMKLPKSLQFVTTQVAAAAISDPAYVAIRRAGGKAEQSFLQEAKEEFLASVFGAVAFGTAGSVFRGAFKEGITTRGLSKDTIKKITGVIDDQTMRAKFDIDGALGDNPQRLIRPEDHGITEQMVREGFSETTQTGGRGKRSRKPATAQPPETVRPTAVGLFADADGKQTEIAPRDISIQPTGKQWKQNIKNAPSVIKAQEVVQDAWIRVKRLMEKEGVKFTDDSNPYLHETLLYGRVDDALSKVDIDVSDIDKELLQAAKASGIKDADLKRDIDDYLISRHAPDYNAELGGKAAGLSTTQAKQNMKRLKTLPHWKDIERLSGKVKALNDRVLDVLLEGEVISKAQVEKWRAKYPNHISLQRIMDDTDDVSDVLIGKGLSTTQTGIRGAKGSDRAINDVWGNAVANLKQAIVRAEKNKVNLATLNLVRENEEMFSGFMRVKTKKAIGKTFDGEGVIFETIRNDEVLKVREGGKEVIIEIDDPNLRRAFQSTNYSELPTLARYVGSVTRFYSGLATRFNPEFALSNVIRDSMDLTVNMGADFGAGASAKTAASIPASAKHVTDWLRGADTEGARLYAEMKAAGGTTGGLGLSTRGQVDLDLKGIQKVNRSTTRKIIGKTIDYIDNWNTIFEDATRLSAYKTAKELGYSVKQAAFIAKNATVNFNKKGTVSPWVNALYMFANASIQGNARVLRSLRKPKVAAAVSGMVGSTVFLSQQMNDAQDPEWRSKVSEYEKSSSLIFVLSPGEKGEFRRIKIPVSWGLRPMKVIADAAYESSHGVGGEKGLAGHVGDVAGAMLQSYNPVGGTDAISAIVPTIGDLPVDLARNKGWHGGKIRPEWKDGLPKSEQYFDSTAETRKGRMAIGAADLLANIGMEASPEDLEYIFDQLSGGTGRAVSRFTQTVIDPFTDEEMPASDYFMLNRFYSSTPKELWDNSLKQKARETFKELLQKTPPESRKAKMREYAFEHGSEAWKGMAYSLAEGGYDTKGVSFGFSKYEKETVENYEAVKQLPEQQRKKFLATLGEDGYTSYQGWALADRHRNVKDVGDLKNAWEKEGMRDEDGKVKKPSKQQLYSHLRKVAILEGKNPDAIGNMPKKWSTKDGLAPKSEDEQRAIYNGLTKKEAVAFGKLIEKKKSDKLSREEAIAFGKLIDKRNKAEAAN